MEAKSIKMTECKEKPEILEEIEIEELAIDGICGVY
ncbi:MAG: variant-type mycofactocin precursor [Syntrophomonas sp.]